MAMMLLLLPFATFAIPTMKKTGTSQTFFGAVICSGNSSDNPKVTVEASFSPALTMSTIATIAIQKIDISGGSVTVLNETDLDADLATLSSRSSGTWHVNIGNSSVSTTFADHNNSQVTKSVSFTRQDAQYRFVIRHGTTGGSTITQFTTNFQLTEGTIPWVRVTNINETVAWTIDVKEHNVLKGCTGNDPRLRVDPFTCGNDNFRVKIGEYDTDAGTYVGTPVEKVLSSSEITDLLSGTGIPINGFTDGSNTITLQTDKHYHISVIYQGQGTWKPAYSVMHYKDGNFDLAMKDTPFDSDGYEPYNKWDNDVFASPDLWNKKSNTMNPTSKTHENPTFASLPGNHNRLMVEIRNVGCSTSTANIPLRLFWTRARTDELWSDHWIYDLVNNAAPDPNTPSIMRPLGSEITISGATQTNPYNTNSDPYLIPAIPAGSTHKISFANGVQWFPPDPTHYDANSGSISNAGHPVICLLARINEPNSSSDPIRYEPTGTTDKILPYVKENNNVVTRNTIVVSEPGFFIADPGGGWNYGFATVMVNNDGATPRTVDLCLDQLIDAAGASTFMDHGNIEIGTTTNLYNAWLTGGSQATNMSIVSPTLFLMTNGSHGCLENITVAPGSTEQIGVRFNYNGTNLPPSPLEYVYQLSQTTGAEPSVEYGSNSVFIAEVPTVTPAPGPQPAFRTTDIEDALADETLGIYPNPSRDFIDILLGGTSVNGSLNIYDMNGKLVQTKEAVKGAEKVRINISTLASGNYTVEFTGSNGTIHRGRFVKK